MTRAARSVALGLALALAGAGRAEDAGAAAKPRIALERLRAVRVSDALADAVEHRVCAALAEVAKAEVVCPSDVAAAAQLAREAMLFGECRSDDCLRRVDAIGSAERRVGGALERGDGGLVLSLQLTGPGGPGPRVVERLPEDLEALLARVPAAVKKLFR